MSLYKFNPADAERFATHVGIRAKMRGHELIFQQCPYCRNHSNDKDKFSINTETGLFDYSGRLAPALKCVQHRETAA